MPQVGERKSRVAKMGDMTKNPMYALARKFCEAQDNMRHSNSSLDFAFNPIRVLKEQSCMNELESFFSEDTMLCAKPDTEQIEEHAQDMHELFLNDVEMLRESATMGLNQYNPLVGMSLPMHKYLMLNCMFAQAVPRYVAKSPSWTETFETRWMIAPDGRKIDIANQQNEIFDLWKSANKPIEVAIALPEMRSVDILEEYFHVPRTSNNLSVATHICAIAFEDYAEKGEDVITIASDGTITETKAAQAGMALKWHPWKKEFSPNYGELNRTIQEPVDIVFKNASGQPEIFHDMIAASQVDNMFEISAMKTKAVKVWARYDASQRNLRTSRVEWSERSSFVQIQENDGITIPITPEEVKDIGATYGINQVTKYMSMIKDILENVKDDDIHNELDMSLIRLDDDHKLIRTINMAPPNRYTDTPVKWMNEMAMVYIDSFITGMLTIWRDPNMTFTIIGRPDIIRNLTPKTYSYESPAVQGAIEMDFKKTVVSSDKRTYTFLSSDKMLGNDELIVLLNPKNTNRIIYRLYDYQMYISNEIRDSENSQLPALTAFQRYRFFGYQETQGRLYVANPLGVDSFLPTNDPNVLGTYSNNDLNSVFSAYDPTTGKNKKPSLFGE